MRRQVRHGWPRIPRRTWTYMNASIASSPQNPEGCLNVATAYRPNHMNDLEFIYYVRRRLLLPAVNELRRCVDTDLEIDPHLDHAFCCIARGRGTTHTYVKNALHK